MPRGGRPARDAAAAAGLLVVLACGVAHAQPGLTPQLPVPAPVTPPEVPAPVQEVLPQAANDLVGGALPDVPVTPTSSPAPGPAAPSRPPAPSAVGSPPVPEATPARPLDGRPAIRDRPGRLEPRARETGEGSRTTRPPAAALEPVRDAVAPARARDEASSLSFLPDIWETMPALVRTLVQAVGVCMALLAILWLLAALRARRLARSHAEAMRDTAVLQRALLPDVPEQLGSVALSAAYRAADGPAAGGDFYDVFALDGSVAVILGDASGHGREALRRATLMHYTLRAYLEAGLSPRAVLELAGRVRAGEADDEFATAVVALFDPSEGTLTYACAGHPPPIVHGPGLDDGPLTACSAPPLGFGIPTGQRQTTLRVPAGGIACLFTDGVVEARTGPDLLGRERFGRLVRELSPSAGAAELLDRVRSQSDRAPDDMAACLIRPLVAGSASPLRVEELELAPGQAAAAERFLQACGLTAETASSLALRVRDAAQRDGRACLRVTFGLDGPQAELLGEPVLEPALG